MITRAAEKVGLNKIIITPFHGSAKRKCGFFHNTKATE